jgi:hypothetical protein
MRKFILGLALVLATAILPGRVVLAASPPAAPGRLVLEDFFRGTLTASGTFLNTRDGSQRGLKVRMKGTWDGRTLTLVEDFVYSDGERDRKTWRFTKVAEGRYVGTREDVLGTADVVQDGDAVRLRYTARVATKGGSSYDIRFDDLLVKTDTRTVRNTADLSFLYVIPVGKVDLTIRRTGRR